MATWVGKFMEKFKVGQDLKFKYHSALVYGLVTLLTVGGESVFSTTIFQCPCSAKWNLPYGLLFLLVPALALFLLSYLVKANIWRLLTGCCKLSPSVSACTCLQKTILCCQLSWTTVLAPLTWVAVALLQGTFFECASSGSVYTAQYLCSKLYVNGTYDYGNCTDQLPLVPCQKAMVAKVQDLLKELKTLSQVAGWILIAAVIISLLIGTSFARCFSPVSFQQLNFWKIYVKQEEKFFKREATECATELAKKNAKSFFKPSSSKESTSSKEEHKADIEQVYIPSSEDWQQISSLYIYNPKYYSTLHKYVNKNGEGQDSRTSQRNKMYHALDFVDEHCLTGSVDGPYVGFLPCIEESHSKELVMGLNTAERTQDLLSGCLKIRIIPYANIP